MGKLDGKIAVITGSGRGIGKATAMLFAKEGAAVVINDVDESVAQETAKEIEAAGGKATYCAANITIGEEAQKLADTASEKFGGLDILVNCAGVTQDAPIHKMTDQQWDLAVNVSLKGSFNCIRAASKYMRKEGHNGRVINISSLAALMGNAGQGNYAAAKGGIISLTKVVAHEWARFGVTCNAVAYGFVDTRMTRAREEQDEEVAGQKLGLPKQMRDMMVAGMGGRVMTPEEAALPILYFALPENWFVNGNVLQAAMATFV